MIGILHRIILSGLLFSPFLLFGQEYFQQQVDHVISVTLDDERHMLHGHQRMIYTNNSPHRLDTIWMHLWANAYADRSTALNKQLVRHGRTGLQFASKEDRGWIDSLDFMTGPARIKWGHHEDHIDVAWLILPFPLASGASVTITTPFRVKIPDSRFSRLGHTGQAYHITQWYPKPAVFDNEGWHAMPYLNQGEFFSEFGTFDVSITLPSNYVVGATGVLQENPEEEQFLDALSRGMIGQPGGEGFPPSDSKYKTLRFVQENVHDHAWFADKRFGVQKSSVTLPRTGRTVTTWAMFTPENAALWSKAVEYVNESVKLYSEWVGDYPYDACTAVDGTISAGGGMEYPMITVIGNMGSEESLDNVIAHEVGHNWFYGILASNERSDPWMDEGINSFLELRYMRERYPSGGMKINVPLLRGIADDIRDGHRFQSEAMYRVNARRNLDQPICLHSTDFTSLNYGGMVYAKPALVFDHLFAYLGADVFDRCMQAYFEEWKFKHPRPNDVRRIFERESGKDLGWLFDDLIKTDRKIDIKAKRLRGDRLDYRITGGTTVPFPITAWKDTVRLGTTWGDGAISDGTITLPWADADVVCIDHDQRTIDIDRRNNQVSAHGLFRRSNLPHLGFLTGLEKHDRHSVYWTPLVARNGHDGWHLGLGMHNYQFPSQRTEWIVAPMYGFNSERVIGGARIEHHFDRMRSRIFQNIGVALNARRASTLESDAIGRWYTKLSPSVEMDLARNPLSRPWQHRIGLRAIYLRHGSEITNSEGSEFGFSREDLYGELSFAASNNSALLPSMIKPVMTGSKDLLRASLEITQGFTYNRRKDQLRLRVFAGTFLWKSDAFLDPLEVWQLSWGPQDMLFDHAYLERGRYSDSFRGRQFNKQQGAFRTPFTAFSDTWTGAVNMEFDLPIGLPISLFASSGIVPMSTHSADGAVAGIASFHEAGVGLQLMRDVIEVWFPLLVSQRIADQETFMDRGVADRIRFVVALERLDPTKILRNLRP